MSFKIGNLDLSSIIYMNGHAVWMPKGSVLGPTFTDSGSKLIQIASQHELYTSDKYISVVPKSILDNVVHSLSSLIQSTFYLNVLGAGLIAVSAIGLWYTKPEYKKTRLGLQALFIAGLATVVFAAFKANSSIISLQKL